MFYDHKKKEILDFIKECHQLILDTTETLIVNSMSVFSPMYGHVFFDEAVKLLLEEEVDFTPLVSHWHPIEKAEEAFETASDVDQSVKVLFNP